MRTLVLAAILLLARPNLGVRSAPAEVARIRWHLARLSRAAEHAPGRSRAQGARDA